jgi:threonine dehydrogenase-like Zn-dependent dehydrogenase
MVLAGTERALRALVVPGPVLQEVPEPALQPGYLRVRVQVVGICRTDLLAAEGKIPVASGRILGHEFSGITDAGKRVAVFPGIPCKNCLHCRVGADPWWCVQPSMLGLEQDGAFAEAVVVPEVCCVETALDFQKAAFAEPVAAALGVRRAVTPEMDILVYGRGRIASLIALVLESHGCKVSLKDPSEELEQSAYDAVVETTGQSKDIRRLIHAIAPHGTLVLRSRLGARLELDPLPIVQKELVLQGSWYGNFQTAVRLLEEGLPVEELFDAPLPLDQWQQAFEAAKGESRKQFLSIFASPV